MVSAAYEPLIGKKFNRLLVIGISETGKHLKLLCQCDCGVTKSFPGFAVKTGYSKSCGCLRVEGLVKRCTTHGKTGTKIYNTWLNMKARCEDEANHRYHQYGGRGIRICERWSKSSVRFIEDMGEPPTSKHSIDRIDNDADYSPENCRWATNREQCAHKRNSRFLTFNGKTQIVSRWAEELGVNASTLFHRLAKGFPVEKVLFGVKGR